MPKSTRYIKSGAAYEIILRVAEGLPFVPKKVVKTLLKSALARTQRNSKLTLCHKLWMTNHIHLLVVAWDPLACVYFYQELQKKITDYYKRLLGTDQLSLWEGSPVVAIILDIEKAIEKIAYIYANPAKAGLTEKIEEYPGLSTWEIFSNASSDIGYKHYSEHPWIRQPMISRLESLSFSASKDELLNNKLLSSAKRTHTLCIEPNAWMGCFGIVNPEDVKRINKSIVSTTRFFEAKALEERKTKGYVGAHALYNTPLMRPHTPKKRERRIFVLSSIAELRISYIEACNKIREICTKCYQLLKLGGSPKWPPGVFRPPCGPIAASLA